jgi:hypothetical protein
MSIVRRASLEEFVASAVGRYVAGRSWVCFHAGTVSGAILWGRVELEDARTLLELAPATFAPGDEPHMVLWEARGVTNVDTGAFDLVEQYFAKYHQAILTKLTRYALVYPEGLLPAAQGYFDLIPWPWPRSTFTDRQSALAWLGVDGLAAELDEAEHVAREAFTDASCRLIVGPEARWFEFAGTPAVSLDRHRAPRFLLQALARARLERPGQALAVPSLFATGWPEQTIRKESAANRVYVAMSTLRSLGLRDVIISREDGYLLRPDVTVSRAPSPSRLRPAG